jgi:putative transposase
LLGTARARDRFVKILDEVRCRHGFRLVGYVVMPEHVHLLISEPAKKNPSKVLQVLKQKVARALLKKRRRTVSTQLSLAFDGRPTEETHFWQRRFYDFNVWSEKKLKEKLEYMHANPVQRKLVGHPREWPWSSWTHYAGRGDARIRIDSMPGDRESQNPHRFRRLISAPPALRGQVDSLLRGQENQQVNGERQPALYSAQLGVTCHRPSRCRRHRPSGAPRRSALTA